MLKSDASRDLVAAVEALQRKQIFFTSKVAKMVPDGYLKKVKNPTERNSREPYHLATTRNSLSSLAELVRYAERNQIINP